MEHERQGEWPDSCVANCGHSGAVKGSAPEEPRMRSRPPNACPSMVIGLRQSGQLCYTHLAERFHSSVPPLAGYYSARRVAPDRAVPPAQTRSPH